ncbi:outer membrane beta-barrel protein [Siphonobacter sp.]|uniref:outer membrane beta-barrel protein n=1 Tax=Siphonobacter sp. TaxID=1869184 RepID=UPI003B3A4011
MKHLYACWALLALLLLPYCPSLAQQSPAKLGLVLDLGTTPGAKLAYGLSPHFTVKAGYNWLGVNLNRSLDISDEPVDVKGKINLSTVNVSVDYHPFVQSAFRVFGGVGYTVGAKAHLTAQPTRGYVYGDTELTPQQLGSMSFEADYGGQVVPFAGIGIGRALPRKRFSVGVELGTYYTQSPKVQMSGTNLFTPMAGEQALVQKNMEDWRFWPVLNVNLAFKLF